jgi:4-diphosphocytidyl-2-C-methyl-D-erythritol kinase
LGLHVTAKLETGYHHLQSVITFVQDIHDILEITTSSGISLEITGPFSKNLQKNQNNSVVQAAQWFSSYFDRPIPYHVRLVKNLPIASGIGGGSSDAAAIIAALLCQENISLKAEDQQSLILASGELGADVPVCLAYQLGMGKTFWIEGTGAQELPFPLEMQEDFSLVLVNSLKAVSTPEVFRLLKSPYTIPLSKQKKVDLPFIQSMKNDLETPATLLCPEIQECLAALRQQPGCLMAQLSGSGATCWGLFQSKQEAYQASLNLNSKWWVRYA